MDKEMKNMQIKAKSEFEAANEYARLANDKLHQSKIILEEWKREKRRLDDWKSIMSTAPVLLFTLIFIMVSIGEYFISYEIYREFNRNIPWLIAIVFFVVGIFVSELLVYKISKEKKEWKYYEINRDPNKGHLTEDQKRDLVEGSTNKKFIFGLFIAFVLILSIGFLSYMRVQEELAADMRETTFGIMDLMPVVLYIVEIFTGAFVLYLIKQIGLSLKVKNLWKKFNKQINLAYRLNSQAINKYLDAEKLDYDPFDLPLTDNIHSAFYRNINKTTDNKEDYLQEPQFIKDVFKLHLVDKAGNPLQRHINIITNYKFSLSGSTNEQGYVELIFEKTFEGDSVKHIFIKESANDEKYISINGNYDLNKDITHKIILDIGT